jgi:hypothetical protein
LFSSATDNLSKAGWSWGFIVSVGKDFEAAVAELKGQIQKVSAQLAAASLSRGGLEASESAPQIAVNKQ